MNKLFFFSLTSGIVYQLPEAYTKKLDTYQIPLLSEPKNTCKKCYGRFYTGYNTRQKIFNMCQKCIPKYLDYKKLQSHINIEIPTETSKTDFVDYKK